MKEFLRKSVYDYVNKNVGEFHRKRIEALNNLKLTTVLKKKNPYLFKAKYLLTAETIIKSITDAFISSNEETVFGDWLEGLAIFINEKVYKGRKSGIPGIDLSQVTPLLLEALEQAPENLPTFPTGYLFFWKQGAGFPLSKKRDSQWEH